MIPILMMSSYVTAKASGNKPAPAIDKNNPVDLQITYKDGERIVTPVEIK